MSVATPITAKQKLLNWFSYLQAMQDAVPNPSEVPSVTPLDVFANSTITTVLTDSGQQNTFITNVQGQTPYSFNESLLLQCSTFESLLEKASTASPTLYFAMFLETCVAKPYSTMSLEDLSGAALSAVFPDGVIDAAWTAFDSGLKSIPSCCYSVTQQNAVKKILAAPKCTVGDLLKQLIILG